MNNLTGKYNNKYQHCPPPNQQAIDKIIHEALAEDIPYYDVTSDPLIPSSSSGNAYFLAKSDGILCGIDIALRTFQLLDPTFSVKFKKNDGDSVHKGEFIAVFTGSLRYLLNGERTALNLLQHLSGIATATKQFVQLVKGTKAQITDTRKTLPGLRAVQKYAVMVGGGKNHRYCLSDGAMIKNNHVDACGGITTAVKILRDTLGHMVKLEVETRNMAEVREAVECGAEIIMLDNMSLDTMREAVAYVGGRSLLEASGGISIETVSDIAQTGVDIISIGALTHSVKAFDISMRIEKGEHNESK